MPNSNLQLHDHELTADAEEKRKTAERLKGRIPVRVTDKYQAFLYALFCFFSFPTRAQPGSAKACENL